MAVSTTVEGPPVEVRAPNRRRFRYRRSEVLWGAAFITPALVLFAVIGVYVIGYGLTLSFADWNGFTPQWTWVGLRNYADLLWRDPVYAPEVHAAALNTLWVLLVVPAVTVLISLPLALLLNATRRMTAVLRSVYFLPYVTNGIAIYFAWQYMLQPDGAVNLLLRMLGLGSLQQPQGWLGNPGTALPTLIVISVWTAVPVAMMLYLAGLQAVDPTLIEAARIDGAGPVRIARSVIWPLLRPITAIVLLLNLRDSLQNFQLFLIMTNGGPGTHTNVLGLEVYRLAFLKLLAPTLGLASALGWMLFLGALVLAAINVRVLRRST
jgi:multiple sugar transport system permease protein